MFSAAGIQVGNSGAIAGVAFLVLCFCAAVLARSHRADARMSFLRGLMPGRRRVRYRRRERRR